MGDVQALKQAVSDVQEMDAVMKKIGVRCIPSFPASPRSAHLRISYHFISLSLRIVTVPVDRPMEPPSFNRSQNIRPKIALPSLKGLRQLR